MLWLSVPAAPCSSGLAGWHTGSLELAFPTFPEPECQGGGSSFLCPQRVDTLQGMGRRGSPAPASHPRALLTAPSKTHIRSPLSLASGQGRNAGGIPSWAGKGSCMVGQVGWESLDGQPWSPSWFWAWVVGRRVHACWGLRVEAQKISDLCPQHLQDSCSWGMVQRQMLGLVSCRLLEPVLRHGLWSSLTLGGQGAFHCAPTGSGQSG